MQLAHQTQEHSEFSPRKANIDPALYVWLFYPVRSTWNSAKGGAFSLIMTLTIISMVFTVTALCWLALGNIEALIKGGSNNVTLSIYLKKDVQSEKVTRFKELLLADSRVAAVEFRSSDDALQIFQNELGERAYLTEGLTRQNPLPASLEVTFSGEGAHSALYELYKNKFSQFPEVELVQYDSLLLGTLVNVVAYFKFFALLLVPALLLVAGFVVFLTLCLNMYAHRKELEIKRLVGASAWFLWSPYLFEGGVLGTLGALAGILLCWCATLVLRTILAQPAFMWIQDVDVLFLSGNEILLLTVFGTLVGTVGGLYAGRRLLRVDSA